MVTVTDADNYSSSACYVPDDLMVRGARLGNDETDDSGPVLTSLGSTAIIQGDSGHCPHVLLCSLLSDILDGSQSSRRSAKSHWGPGPHTGLLVVWGLVHRAVLTSRF